jgi:putative membrane protein
MHIGSHYRFIEFVLWTRKSILWLALSAIVPTAMYQLFDMKWIAIPWIIVALVGTAASFIAGFKNTQTYNRMWEARQIWGGITNSSRSWGIMVMNYVRENECDKNICTELIYRHIAWLTALRFQLREPKQWENVQTKHYNAEYKKLYHVQEWDSHFEDEISKHLTKGEIHHILLKHNPATQILALQSQHLKDLNKGGLLKPIYFVEMMNAVKSFYEHQGKSERIKAYPYPRQFSSINLFFTRLLVHLLPLGMLSEFAKLGHDNVWLTIPFSIIVGWVFTSLEQVGESTENPFEGGANDIPITAISRNIEIDLLEIIGAPESPPPISPQNNILM